MRRRSRLSGRRPSHPYDAGTEHAGVSPTMECWSGGAGGGGGGYEAASLWLYLQIVVVIRQLDMHAEAH